MVIVMEHAASEEQVQKVIESLVEVGYDVHRSSGIDYTVLGAVGVPHKPVDPRLVEVLPGVREVIRVSEPYKLAGRTFKAEDTIVDVAGVKVGGPEVIAMAGPCSVESPRAGRRRRALGRRLRRPDPARGRLQAPHLAVRLPGLRRGGAQVDARGRRRERHGGRQRGHGPASDRDDDALRRLPAGRRPQHAELRPAEGARPRAQARPPQARALLPRSRSGCSPPSTSCAAATAR